MTGIKKSVLSNITFILNVLSEDGVIFIWMELFLKIKKCLFHKNVFFQNEAVDMGKYT